MREETQAPLVSVLCMTYNHAAYIRECLDGFLSQETDFPFEVLVHDDASTDGTAEIVRDYAARRPDVIRPVLQTENQYSRDCPILERFLLPRARGTYLALCEGDDYWCDPHKLQKQVDALQAHPGCRFSAHGYDVIREDGSFVRRGIDEALVLETGEVPPDWIVRHSHPPVFHTSTVFFYAEDLRRYYAAGLRPRGIPQVGDVELLLCLCALSPCYYIADVMSRYRRDAVGSWTLRVARNTKKRLATYVAAEAAYADYDRLTEGRFHDACEAVRAGLNEKIFLLNIKPRFLLKRANRARLRRTFPDRREQVKLVVRAFSPRLLDAYERRRAKRRSGAARGGGRKK